MFLFVCLFVNLRELVSSDLLFQLLYFRLTSQNPIIEEEKLISMYVCMYVHHVFAHVCWSVGHVVDPCQTSMRSELVL